MDIKQIEFIFRYMTTQQRIKRYNIKVNVGSIEALNE